MSSIDDIIKKKGQQMDKISFEELMNQLAVIPKRCIQQDTAIQGEENAKKQGNLE